MKVIYRFILAAAALGFGAGLGAQTLPELEKASEITTGSLPNGISYYLVKNSGTPGFADFALVQPLRNDRVGARENLVSLPHFFGRKPYRFLASNGVGYGERGYIQHFRNSTVFRFADVPVSGAEVCDSMLLMLFDLARASEYEQAIVVSGNIDVPGVIERIRILSMTIPRRLSVEDSWAYGWKQQDKPIITTATSPVGSISVFYRSPRTERELMNTIQPVMSRLLASELDIVLNHRLRAAFIDAGLPLVDYRFRYLGSDETASDELFSLNVFTSSGQLEQALKTVAGVLASLDNDGVSLEEVNFARSVIAEATVRDNANYKPSNAQYLDKCIAAYLYGSNLASSTALSPIFSGRRLDLGRERELLDRYISATFSSTRNLHLRVTAPDKPDAALVERWFADGWAAGCTAVSDIPTASDTLKLSGARRKKSVKLKTASTDAFTGGKLWVFSNGVSVVFKRTKDKNAFHYGLLVKGGWPDIPGINGTEPAFARDVLALGKVAGMGAEHFRDLMSMYGITMEPDLTISDIRMSGTAPSSSLSLVLKSLVAVVNTSETDDDAYRRYREIKPVLLVRDKFSETGTTAVLDSIMCPGYKYASGSLPELPSADFNARLAQYLSQKGANMKNGVLVLMGDLDEDATLRMLTHTLGEFSSGQQRVVRPKLNYPLRKCWTTTAVQRNWRSHGVSVSLAALWPVSAEGYCQMELACTLLKFELDKALASEGMSCKVSGSSELFPAEKMTIHVHCLPITPAGLPADVSPALPVQALNTVRSVLNRLSMEEVSPAQLDKCKTMLADKLKMEDGNTALLRDAVLQRSSVGRDVRAGVAQRLKTVRPADMRRLFTELSACTCEYIVQ